MSGSAREPPLRPAFSVGVPSAEGTDPGGEPDVRMDRRVHGKIVGVNFALRFVVMDFPVWCMPIPEQRLDVYRDDQKIGEVKVTGPTVDTTVAGDLIAGEAGAGDEVRE